MHACDGHAGIMHLWTGMLDGVGVKTVFNSSVRKECADLSFTAQVLRGGTELSQAGDRSGTVEA